MRLAEPHEIPRGAGTVQRIAEAAGWTVRPTYARGTAPGRKPRVIDSLALRMRRGGSQCAVAVWEDGKFALAFVWGAGFVSPRWVNNTDLKKHLKEPT